MMARIVTQKPDPGNRVGLHYSPFQQSSPIRAPSIQLLARARSTQNRILEQPIREVGLACKPATVVNAGNQAAAAPASCCACKEGYGDRWAGMRGTTGPGIRRIAS